MTVLRFIAMDVPLKAGQRLIKLFKYNISKGYSAYLLMLLKQLFNCIVFSGLKNKQSSLPKLSTA
jgi:hypothetical protein